MKAKSIKGKSTAEIEAALAQSMAGGFKPTLAIIFISNSLDQEAVSELLDEQGIAIFGATTSGEFTEEGVESKSVVILLLDINTEYFRIVLHDNLNRLPEDSARQAAETGRQTFSNPAFIISVSNLKTPGQSIIKGFVDSVGKDVTIIGGYSGNMETYEGNVFTNNQSSSYGLLALILDQDKIDVMGEAVSGWRAVGTVKRVTQSDGPWVSTIDNQPAMDVVKKYIGGEIMGEESTTTNIRLNTMYPLQVDRDGDSPGMVATLEFNTENKAVLCTQPMPEGTTFRFSLPPDFDVIDTVIESSRKIKEQKMPKADAMIVFSCAGRFLSLGPLVDEEIKGLINTWEKPAVGFFSLGEFGRVAGGKPESHGTTCSWAALKEKS